MERIIIRQSEAARQWNNGKGCSRQRINELVKQGRFSVPVDVNGQPMPRRVYLDEVLNFEEAPTGRPHGSQNKLHTDASDNEHQKTGKLMGMVIPESGTFRGLNL